MRPQEQACLGLVLGIHVRTLDLEGGRRAPTEAPDLGRCTLDTPFLYLTTVGRKSGRPREIEIWFTERRGRYYVIAETRERAHWVQNILAEPRVLLRVGAARFAGRGRVVDPAKEPELSSTVQALSEEKYGWGDGLVVELTPDSV